MKYVTLNAIKRHKPCSDGWATLLKYLGKTGPDDDPLSLRTIYDSNGLDDALWCLRALDDTYLVDIQRLALKYARSVQHLMTDQRSIDALDVTERYLNGDAARDELRRAADAAYAARAALAAHATLAAYAATYATLAAYAASAAGAYAADAATRAADAAAYAAYAAAAYAASADTTLAADAAVRAADADVERIFLEFCDNV